MKKIIRCDWANKSELEQKYHDEEWAVPVHDDQPVRFDMAAFPCMACYRLGCLFRLFVQAFEAE